MGGSGIGYRHGSLVYTVRVGWHARWNRLSARRARQKGAAATRSLPKSSIFLPEGRVGNVVCRPVLREYEIPFLAAPGVPPDRQLPLSDLTLSLRGGRIVLRSRRLGREVIPRLSSAHDFTATRSLKIYKFLCLLQQQGVTPWLSWDWDQVPRDGFLPRVVFGNVVLSPACWILDGPTTQQLCRGQGDQRPASADRSGGDVSGSR